MSIGFATNAEHDYVLATGTPAVMCANVITPVKIAREKSGVISFRFSITTNSLGRRERKLSAHSTTSSKLYHHR